MRATGLSLAEKDKKYLWHPFTQMKEWQQEALTIIESGEGVYLLDTEGKRYLDGVSSLWCNVHGHQVPEIDQAITEQLKKIGHSTFLGLSNAPAIELAERLIEITPQDLTRVFYSDSGSEAVEIALKMAFQYWAQKGSQKKSKFVRLSHAYHGDTLGAVSVGGIELFHEIYQSLLFEAFEVPSPYVYRWRTKASPEQVKEETLRAMEKTLREHHEEIAALVMEPLMQGAAGMINQPQGFILRARELTRKYNVLLIFDEVATGFGRTGKMFACEHESVTPDLLCVAKGLTGGYLPLAATITTEEVYEAFLGEPEELKTFFHGHTFTGNPLACSAALASLRLFEKNEILERLQGKIELLREALQTFRELPMVGDIRQVGVMIGIELVKDQATKEAFPLAQKIGAKVAACARKKGAILRPLGPVVVLMPPLAMSEEELAQLLKITYDSIKEVGEGI